MADFQGRLMMTPSIFGSTPTSTIPGKCGSPGIKQGMKESEEKAGGAGYEEFRELVDAALCLVPERPLILEDDDAIHMSSSDYSLPCTESMFARVLGPVRLVLRVENRLAQDAYKKHGDLHKQKNEDGKEVGGMKLILPSTTKLWARFRKSESPNSDLGALTSTRHNAAVGWASPTIMLDTGWGSTGSSVPNLSLYD
ncbi:hypothetical protein B0H14DRAFT_2585781 [Mycena olivaceomarginata]|nr:hypothetical protein B0H14DRAFT_2585781 [Mycena olivaceomarginata]